jgi:transcriptional regulator with XRE-family HTH domain
VSNTFGDRVLKIRKTLGLSQEAFGAKIGMGRSAISKIEKGENELTEKNIKLICKQFGISKDWILTGEGEMRGDEMSFLEVIMGGLGEIDPLDQEIIKAYLRLDERYREVFWEFLDAFTEARKAK